jgi:signal transduction histidine kinase
MEHSSAGARGAGAAPTPAIIQARPDYHLVTARALLTVTVTESSDDHDRRIPVIQLTLQRALIGSMMLAIVVGNVPAGMALHARLSSTLVANARRDLGLAPRVLLDRSTAIGDALMMRAKELAHDDALAAAVARGDRAAALQVLTMRGDGIANMVTIVVAGSDTTWTGPRPPPALIQATRTGLMPVELSADRTGVRYFSLAPIEHSGRWVGAAGYAVPMDVDAARVLAALTRSEVVILAGMSDTAMASTLDTVTTTIVASAIRGGAEPYRVPQELGSGDRRLLVTTASFGSGGTAGTVAFVRLMRQELAILPSLRRLALGLGALSLAAALLLGAWLTTLVTEPVKRLSEAARALGAGADHLPLPQSRFRDIAVVSQTFEEMRHALATRMSELARANRALSDHSARLAALQNDLLHRERLDAASRMVGQLAHEVRNPVASLRNLLELIRRRSTGDETTREYADLAIDELLRMHELAERMLDLNRPSRRSSEPAVPFRVAGDVARLAMFGLDGGVVSVTGDREAMTALGSDALKQVLLNLVQNAHEAMRGGADRQVRIDVAPAGERVRIVVSDNGPGISNDILPRIFDPFVTSKQSVLGVGLGLYVAESTVRSAGGTIVAANAPSGGAVFTIHLPATTASGS